MTCTTCASAIPEFFVEKCRDPAITYYSTKTPEGIRLFFDHDKYYCSAACQPEAEPFDFSTAKISYHGGKDSIHSRSKQAKHLWQQNAKLTKDGYFGQK